MDGLSHRPRAGDLTALPNRMTPLYICPTKRNLRRGDRVKIKGGLYDRAVGMVDSVVFQQAEDQPAVGLVLAAIMVSMLAAALKASSIHFTIGGWEFDPNSLYHVAQMSGLFLLLITIQRRSDAAGEAPVRQATNVAALA